jgi:N4-gp56 family major capsid protein
MSNAVQTAYDKRFEFALRDQPLFRALADKRPEELTAPGQSIVLEIYKDMDAQTTALAETVDPDAVAIDNPDTLTLTVNEYGNAVLRTRKLRMFSITDVDPAIANMLAYNCADSIDILAQTELRGGSRLVQVQGGDTTYVTNATSATAAATMVSTVTSGVATDGFTSSLVRLGVAKMRTAKAVPRRGSMYGCYIHPEVSHDLRQETGDKGWRLPHMYSAVGNVWSGEIGEYEGCFFVESPRCYQAVDAGASTTVRRFRTYMVGQQALAEGVAEEPHVVAGPIVDKLARFRPLGWYGIVGWKRYREEALTRIETTSSIDAT